ncbi:NUDIX domain-containing protein [Algoriphagus limi]|uniref:NUDIX domain-containing protein n=1 Tax=Algoriphagus limi TaxID=2975273 RepID=A0ABT2G448_9BACT|nr:NUDIX domain-containing protein [Algoriphagus limi]MCS5490039.1 NUDIX domain-containing protein [Algoriphagus limi]
MTRDKIGKQIESKFGNRLRTRVNGILIQDEKLLMVRHLMGDKQEFWSVPGGGMRFGSDASSNLKREFMEETGLEISVGDFLFVHEFLEPPLHAIELFFKVNLQGGELTLGHDPELEGLQQIITDIQWLSLPQIQKIPKKSLHQVFWAINSFEDIGLWKGYFNFENKYLK